MAGMQHKILLDESQLPTQWYNVVPDLPSPPPPPLHPGTLQPVGPTTSRRCSRWTSSLQEVTGERFVDIPGEVLDVYKLWRPSPLYRAHRLEKALGTPARIYYKYEGVSPAGSHKPNTAVPQAYYNAKAGVRKLTTETGAGQWGTALAFASALFGLECEVWMVGASYDQKPYRRTMMEIFGAHGAPLAVRPHPGRPGDPRRRPGAPRLARHRDQRGGRGRRAGPGASSYALGSVLNHVLLHQTVIGEEALLQFAAVGETPDLIVGCTGGGSNFGGLTFPFLREKLAGRMSPVIRAVEPASCPSLTRGVYAYDFGDTAGMTPLLKMHTLGHEFIPDPIHAGGLRYHGMSPLLSHVYELGLIEALARAADRVLRRCGAVRADGRDRPRAGADPRAGRVHPRGARPARSPARRRSSSRRSAGTGTSTWPPTTPTCPVAWSTRTCPTSASPARSASSPRSPPERPR